MRTGRSFALTPGGWPSVGYIYLFGVLATASLSKIIPLLGDIGLHMGGSPAQAALLISLLGVLPALLASMAGSFIDRVGAPRALQVSALIGAAVNAAYFLAPSLSAFMVIRVFEGLIATCAFSAAPALIMATTSDARRRRAMAVWSTYTPVGFSLGLVLGGAFAGTAQWRGAYLVHLVLFAALLATSWALPRAPAVAVVRAGGLFTAWAERGPLRLAMTFAVLVLIGFGMSNVYPEWYARQHGVTTGAASTMLGIVNLAMIPAGFLAGALVARGWRDGRLVTALLVATAALSWPLFMPGLDDALRWLTMLAWVLVQGALLAAVTSALPRVVANPAQGAAAAGLLSQLAAAVTFVTPLVWQPFLHRGQWQGFVGITIAAAIAAAMLFPRSAGVTGTRSSA